MLELRHFLWVTLYVSLCCKNKSLYGTNNFFKSLYGTTEGCHITNSEHGSCRWGSPTPIGKNNYKSPQRQIPRIEPTLTHRYEPLKIC